MPWLPSRSSSHADDARHRDPRVAVDRREQPDLGEPAAAPEREDRVGAGLLAADRVDGDVAAAAGEVRDGSGHVDAVREDRVVGAEPGRDGERLGVAVDRDDPGADGLRDHHRAEPDARRSRRPSPTRRPRRGPGATRAR